MEGKVRGKGREGREKGRRKICVIGLAFRLGLKEAGVKE